MTKRQRKNSWKVWLAILIALITPLIVARFYDSWTVKASDLIDPTRVSTISYNDPHPELPQLPPTVEETIRWAFKDKGEAVVKEALLVFRCESGLRTSAYGVNKNGSTDIGVAQINSVHKVPERFLKNVKVNVAVARQIYDEQGWVPWVCARKVGLVK